MSRGLAGSRCILRINCKARHADPNGRTKVNHELIGDIITESQHILDPAAAVGDNFGFAVAVYDAVMVVGAWSTDTAQGGDAGKPLPTVL